MKAWKVATGRSVDGMRAAIEGRLPGSLDRRAGERAADSRGPTSRGRTLGGSALQRIALGLDWDLT